jgi:hypothetical protein
MNAAEIVKVIWPIIIIQLIVQIYALVDLIKRKKTKNLSVAVWIIIIILGEIIGPVLYLLVGKAED